MTNEINQLLIALGSSIALAILVVLGVINRDIMTDIRECKLIFKDFCGNGYHYRGHIGDQIWFSRNDQIGQSYQYNEIVFFGDGSIKLRENYYIHTGFLTFTLVQRYYYRKFHRVKEQYINRHLFNARFRRVGDAYVRDHSIGSKDINSFKFLRG